MASAWQDECALRQTQGALIIVVALVNALEVGRHVAGARYLITFIRDLLQLPKAGVVAAQQTAGRTGLLSQLRPVRLTYRHSSG